MGVVQRASVVMVIRRTNDYQPRILTVTNRRYGGIGLPGGKSEPHEDPKRTACRELHEETGMVCIHSDLVLLCRDVNRIEKSLCEVSVYFARVIGGSLKNVEEGTVFGWHTLHELLDGSPFKNFYAKHFPDGVHHLRTTLFDTSNPKGLEPSEPPKSNRG